MAKPKKKSRKELLREDDAFVQAANQSAEWVGDHRSTVLISSAVVLVLVLGAWMGANYLKDKKSSAGDAYQSAMKTLAATVVEAAEEGEEAPSEVLPGDADDNGEVYDSDEAKWKAALQKFETVISDYPQTGAAKLARFYAGDLKQKLGDKDAAFQSFKSLAKDLKPDDSLAFLAVERAAYLKESEKDLKRASEIWQKLTTAQDAFYADRGYFQMGRLALESGDMPLAKSHFEKLKSDFPDSSVLTKAEVYLSELGSTGDAGDGESGDSQE